MEIRLLVNSGSERPTARERLPQMANCRWHVPPCGRHPGERIIRLTKKKGAVDRAERILEGNSAGPIIGPDGDHAIETHQGQIGRTGDSKLPQNRISLSPSAPPSQ